MPGASPNFSDKPAMSFATEASGASVLGMLADDHQRLTVVEADNADMRAQIDAARKSGDLDLDLSHVQHVLDKHFYHDKPEPEKAPPLVPKYDPYTGQALN
jgi:hypothetical protein